MFCITVVYPKLQGTNFDLSLYVSSHIPSAMRLLENRSGSTVQKIELLSDCKYMGAEGESHDCHCICNMHFKERKDIENMLKLKDIDDDETRKIQRNMKNYTDVEPFAYISEVTNVDVMEILDRPKN